MDGVGIQGVCIIVDNKVIAKSDIDGKYSIDTDYNDNIHLYHANYNPKSVNVAGLQEIDIELTRNNTIIIDEDISNSHQLYFDDVDMQIRGEYLYFDAKFRIPKRLLNDDSCFIMQPVLRNFSTQESLKMHPVVLNGAHYEINRNRRLEFNPNNDSLIKYVVANDLSTTRRIYNYSDSLYLGYSHLDDNYQTECYINSAGYKIPDDIRKNIDTIIIAQGVSNPLRLGDYDELPMSFECDTLHFTNGEIDIQDYSEVYPSPEYIQHSERGSAYIEFNVNTSTIDYRRANNRKNIEEVRGALRGINADSTIKLESISMIGLTSPEGGFQLNEKLASERAKSLLEIIERDIDSVVLQQAKLSYSGEVLPWSVVVDLMCEDGLTSLANRVEKIVEKHGAVGMNTQKQIQLLPEYNSVIKSRYLPKLRRVDFTFDYSQLGIHTTEEIKNMIENNPDQVSRHHFYQIINDTADSHEAAIYEALALERFPDFVWVINRVCERLILSDSVNLDIFTPLSGDKVPYPVRYNQTIMALRSHDYPLADSLINTMPPYQESRYLQSLLAAISGDVDSSYNELTSRENLNSVMTMLAVGNNIEAYELITRLTSSEPARSDAKALYLGSICAKRVDDLNRAIKLLAKALEIDSSLNELARKDYDISNIYKLISLK